MQVTLLLCVILPGAVLANNHHKHNEPWSSEESFEKNDYPVRNNRRYEPSQYQRQQNQYQQQQNQYQPQTDQFQQQQDQYQLQKDQYQQQQDQLQQDQFQSQLNQFQPQLNKYQPQLNQFQSELDQLQQDQPQQWQNQPWNQNKFVKEVQFVRHQHPEHMYRQTKETEVRKIMKKIQRNNDNTWGGVWMTIKPQEPSTYEEAAQSLKKINEEEKAAFHDAVMASSSDQDVELNATDLLKKNQYPVQELIVKTDDGYYLNVIHIPAQQRNGQPKNEAVFLMHGILGSADDFLIMGPGKSLAYLLSDAGYDVYLGNARGSKYARQHVSKHPATEGFWQFSSDEIALHDLPAMIDAALTNSQQDKLTYIGYSQGATALFALLSTRPQYNEKIKTMFAVAPIVYTAHAQAPIIKMLKNSETFDLGRGKFQPSKELLYNAGGQLCQNAVGCRKVCSNSLFAIAGVNVEHLDASRVPAILSHSDTTSVKVMKQLAQWMDGEFRRYDYGTDVNEEVYGQQQAPKYELSAVRVPVALYYSEQDWLAQPEDVETLQRQLPNMLESNKLPEEYFSHTDFQFSKNAPEYIYKKIISTMDNN